MGQNEEEEKNQGETEQEKSIRVFLFEHGIAYQQHKRIIGDGQKIWIVDFYLPEKGIIIEAKTIHWVRRGNQILERNISSIYKDLYKLDELIRRYNLVGILHLSFPVNPAFMFGKTFISNLNEHGIYCITENSQILAILQKQKVEKINAMFESPTSPKPKEAYIFADKELELIHEWAEGKSYRELGLHAMQLHRKLRKYVMASLENRRLDAENQNQAH